MNLSANDMNSSIRELPSGFGSIKPINQNKSSLNQSEGSFSGSRNENQNTITQNQDFVISNNGKDQTSNFVNSFSGNHSSELIKDLSVRSDAENENIIIQNQDFAIVKNEDKDQTSNLVNSFSINQLSGLIKDQSARSCTKDENHNIEIQNEDFAILTMKNKDQTSGLINSFSGNHLSGLVKDPSDPSVRIGTENENIITQNHRDQTSNLVNSYSENQSSLPMRQRLVFQRPSSSEDESSELESSEQMENSDADSKVDAYFKFAGKGSINYKDKFTCEDLLYVAGLAVIDGEYLLAQSLHSSESNSSYRLEVIRRSAISEIVQGQFAKATPLLETYVKEKNDINKDDESIELWKLIYVLRIPHVRLLRGYSEELALELAATLCAHKLFKAAEYVYGHIVNKDNWNSFLNWDFSIRVYQDWGVLRLLQGNFESALKKFKKGFPKVSDTNQLHPLFKMMVLLLQENFESTLQKFNERFPRVSDIAQLHPIFKIILPLCASREPLIINQDKNKELLEIANTFRNLKKYGLAEKLYEEILEIDPTFYSLYRDWGICLLVQGKYEAAVKIFGYALKIHPTDNELNLLTQTSLRIHEIISAVLKKYDEKITDSQQLRALANRFRDHSVFDLSEILYKKLLKLDPNDSEIYRDYGINYLLSNEIDKAIEMIEKGLEIKPKRAELCIMQGVALQRMNKIKKEPLDKIELCYLEALKLDPSSKVASILLGNLLISERKYGEAVQVYTQGSPSVLIRAHSTSDEDPSYREDLDFDEVRSAISKDSDLNNSFISDINQLISLSHHEWDMKLGKSLCRAYFLWGKALITQQGKFKEAMEKFEVILDLNSYYLPDVRFFLACISLLQNDFDKAVQHLAQVFRPDPDFENKPGADKLAAEMVNMTNVQKAAHLRKKGFYKEAIDEYKAELEISQDALEKWELGKLYLRAGSQKEAHRLIKEAFENNNKIINNHIKGVKLPKK